jgi:hypothetical protein
LRLGPGRSMQKLSARRNWFSPIQRRRSTASWRMTAICPAGPPKLIKPSLVQNFNASLKSTAAVFVFMESPFQDGFGFHSSNLR